jgi:uncharacterized protein YoxC
MNEQILSVSALIISVGGAMGVISRILKIAFRVEALEKEVEKNKRKLDDIADNFNSMFDKLENTLSDINVKLARLETKLENN